MVLPLWLPRLSDNRTLLFIVGIAFLILVIGGLRLSNKIVYSSLDNISAGRDVGGATINVDKRKGKLAVQSQEHSRIIDAERVIVVTATDPSDNNKKYG
jgi:hypothetical protein